MTGSYFGAGTGSGSFIGPPNGSSLLLTEILWDIITTAPSDTPDPGTMRQYINHSGAAPYRRLYTYDATAGWDYVEN